MRMHIFWEWENDFEHGNDALAQMIWNLRKVHEVPSSTSQRFEAPIDSTSRD